MDGRILAVDYGRRRLGLALSDPLGWSARPLGVLVRRGFEADVERLAALCREHGVVRVVVGLPVRLGGEAGPEAAEALRFAARLARELDVPVEPWDERLTSRAAERLLVEAGVRRRRRRTRVDAVAAALILQGYLERRRRAGGPEGEGGQAKGGSPDAGGGAPFR